MSPRRYEVIFECDFPDCGVWAITAGELPELWTAYHRHLTADLDQTFDLFFCAVHSDEFRRPRQSRGPASRVSAPVEE